MLAGTEVAEFVADIVFRVRIIFVVTAIAAAGYTAALIDDAWARRVPGPGSPPAGTNSVAPAAEFTGTRQRRSNGELERRLPTAKTIGRVARRTVAPAKKIGEAARRALARVRPNAGRGRTAVGRSGPFRLVSSTIGFTRRLGVRALVGRSRSDGSPANSRNQIPAAVRVWVKREIRRQGGEQRGLVASFKRAANNRPLAARFGRDAILVQLREVKTGALVTSRVLTPQSMSLIKGPEGLLVSRTLHF